MKNNSKLVIYQILLLIFIGLLTVFLFRAKAEVMSMTTVISVSSLIAIYAVIMSLVGEGKTIDERESTHRYTSNRLALIVGTILISGGVLYQLFTHSLDYWLLTALIVINLVKILSLIYLDYKN